MCDRARPADRANCRTATDPRSALRGSPPHRRHRRPAFRQGRGRSVGDKADEARSLSTSASGCCFRWWARGCTPSLTIRAEGGLKTTSKPELTPEPRFRFHRWNYLNALSVFEALSRRIRYLRFTEKGGQGTDCGPRREQQEGPPAKNVRRKQKNGPSREPRRRHARR